MLPGAYTGMNPALFEENIRLAHGPTQHYGECIAVFQAVDRLGSLLGSVKPFLNAPKDVG